MLDGALAETLDLRVGSPGVGRVLISGVAADGSRSRVIVSPANGKNSEDVYVDEAGYAQVARGAGSNGRLEIREGGLLRVIDGDGTHGPLFDVARNKGSVGTVIVDGAGSSLEIIQHSPAVYGNPDVYAGPAAQLGRRGGATTIIRNGGMILVRGEDAFVRISRDSTYQRYTDPDTGPINQSSTLRIESGGRMEVHGARATLVVGDSGPAADGTLIVTGQGSVLVLTGAGNRLVVGDDGARGRVEVHDGATARYATLVVGANGTTNLPTAEGVAELVDALVGDILPPEEIAPRPVDDALEVEAPDDTSRRESAEERTATAAEEEPSGDEDEDDDEDDDGTEEVPGLGERGDEEPEELPMCPA